MKIYKLASVKQRIQQFKLKNPFLIFFLQKYENLIPWGEISSEEDINNYIQNNLLRSLYDIIDPKSPKSNYMRNIDLEQEFQNNQNNPQVQQAYQIYKQDPETAKENRLGQINKEKESIYFNWWKNVNAIYKNEPAFAYSILKPIFIQFTGDNKKTPQSFDESSVNQIYSLIQNKGGKENFKVEKVYSEEFLNKKTGGASKSNKTGWIVIPSLKNDPENFEDNKEILSAYSRPNGWCTGSGMAHQYLSGGDFHLYIDNGKAEVAIRMSGDNVGEIQGERNQPPYAYVDEIERYASSIGLDISSSYHYRALMATKQINDNLLNAQDSYEFLKQYKEKNNDFYHFSRISQSTLENENVVNGIMNYLKLEYFYKNSSKFMYAPRYWFDLSKPLRQKLFEKDPTFCIAYWENIFNKSYGTKLTDKNYITAISSRLDDFLFSNNDFINIFSEALNKEVLESPEVYLIIDDKFKKYLRQESVSKSEENEVISDMIEIKEYEGNFSPNDLLEEYCYISEDYPRHSRHTGDQSECERKQELVTAMGYENVWDIPAVMQILYENWRKYIEKDFESRSVEFMDDSEHYLHESDIEGIQDWIRTEWENKINENPVKYWDDAPWVVRESFENPDDVFLLYLANNPENMGNIFNEPFITYISREDYNGETESALQREFKNYIMKNPGEIYNEEQCMNIINKLYDFNSIKGIVDNFVKSEKFKVENLEYMADYEDLLDYIYLSDAFDDKFINFVSTNPLFLKTDEGQAGFENIYFDNQDKLLNYLLSNGFDFKQLGESAIEFIIQQHDNFDKIKYTQWHEYEKNQKRIEQENKNQEKFNFYDSIRQNDIQLNDAGNIVPANRNSWYKKALSER